MKKQLPILAVAISAIALIISLFNQNSSKEVQQLTSEDVLAPDDLGVQKYIFRSKPAADEVVLLEGSIYFEGELVRKAITYYHTDQQVKEVPLLLVDKTFFETLHEEQQNRKLSPSFRPANFAIKCGGFSHDFDWLHFNGASISCASSSVKAGAVHLEQNTNRASFEFIDVDNLQAKEEGAEVKKVTFVFTMKCIPYKQAKANQPMLGTLEPDSGWIYMDYEFGKALQTYMKFADTTREKLKQY